MTEDQMLSVWSFAVSPHGLGLTTQQFWAITPREYYALKKVVDDRARMNLEMFADLQATLHNAHFVTNDVPWTREDFLGGSDRQERVMKQKVEQIKVDRKARRLQRGDDSAVPDWVKELKTARGQGAQEQRRRETNGR